MVSDPDQLHAAWPMPHCLEEPKQSQKDLKVFILSAGLSSIVSAQQTCLLYIVLLGLRADFSFLKGTFLLSSNPHNPWSVM